jgi:tetratricopeptide (TPR) repeat protein
MSQNKFNHFLEVLNSKLLYLLTFLIPIFFIPSVFVSLDSTKYLIFTVGSLILAIISLAKIFSEKRFDLPHKFVFWSTLLLILSLLISSFSSNNPYKSIFGQGFEVQTFVFILSAIIFTLIVASFAKTKEKILKLFISLSLSYVLLLVFLFLRIIFGPEFLGFSLFSSVLATPMMSYYSLCILASLFIFVSIALRKYISLPKRPRITPLVLEVLSFVVVLLSNNTKIYIISLVGFIVFLITNILLKNQFKKYFIIPLVMSVILLLSIILRSSIISPMVHSLRADYGEITLSQTLTNTVLSQTLTESPIVGYGPNRFIEAFVDSKGIEFNRSPFWSVEFSSGFSFVSTYIVGTGIIGILTILLLLALFVVSLIKIRNKLSTDPMMKCMLTGIIPSIVMIIVSMFLYNGAHMYIFIVSIVFGIYLSLVSEIGIFPRQEIDISKTLVKNIFRIISVLFIILFAYFIVKTINQFIALNYFGRGIRELSVLNGDPLKAEKYFEQSIKHDRQDIYYQALSESEIMYVGALVKTVKPDDQSGIKKVGDIFNKALNNAKIAQSIDPKNYYNFVSEARVSEAAQLVGIKNGYENAVNAYNKAILINKGSPVLYLALARIHATNNNLDEALLTLGKAIAIKNDYLDAIFLASQIYATQGKVNDALLATQVALKMNPNSQVLWFQSGILKYSNKDYEGAASDLLKSITLQPDYANAKYFLGLSMAKLGKYAEAIKYFTELATQNPDNKEISEILSDLKAGISPFKDAVKQSPIKSAKLPIKEKNK